MILDTMLEGIGINKPFSELKLYKTLDTSTDPITVYKIDNEYVGLIMTGKDLRTLNIFKINTDYLTLLEEADQNMKSLKNNGL